MPFKDGRVLIGAVSLFLLCCVYLGFSFERDYQYQAYADCFADHLDANADPALYGACEIIMTHKPQLQYAVE